MKVLRIFDVSPFVHAGAVNKYAMLLPELVDNGESFEERRIYAGGASLIWNVLYYEYGKCDMVFCCDRWPSVKQGMYEYYKANREHKEGIHKAKEVTEYILNDCGFTVLAEEGYEADDFIYSLVRDHKKHYDHIYIYTEDSDLYFLVSDNVTVLPNSSRSKTVTKQNFTYTARTGKYTPYNALTFYKILEGDKSDNIPPLPGYLQSVVRNVFDKEIYHPVLGDKETVSQLLNPLNPEIAHQVSLVFPLDMQVPREFATGDKIRIAEWGNAFRNKLWKHNKGIPAHIQEKIEEMADMGLYTEV